MKLGKDFTKIIQSQKHELVGKLMKRYEVLFQRLDLTYEQRKNLLRILLKEVIHENYRDLESKIDCYIKGIEHFKVEIQRPS